MKTFLLLYNYVRQLKHLLKNISINKATPSIFMSDKIFNENKSNIYYTPLYDISVVLIYTIIYYS